MVSSTFSSFNPSLSIEEDGTNVNNGERKEF